MGFDDAVEDVGVKVDVSSGRKSLSLAQALDKLNLIYKPATRTLEPTSSRVSDPGHPVDCCRQPRDYLSGDHDEQTIIKPGINVCDKVDFKDGDSGFFVESPRSTLEKGLTGSLPCTEASSFSSLCSINHEDSESEEDDIERRTSEADGAGIGGERKLRELELTREESFKGGKGKRRGIANIFNGIFSWKKPTGSLPTLGPVPSVSQGGAGALILESRPANLPAKASHEQARHVVLYRQMLDAAKRKEFMESRRREKEVKKQLRQEEAISEAAQFWSTQVLSDWENMRRQRRTLEMFAKGLPPSVRGPVWKRAFGNKLNISSETSKRALQRATEEIHKRENKTGFEDEVDSIVLDISRTFPSLGFFQMGGPYHSTLHALLTAYATERPETGYVQGMSFLGAVLLLQMDVEDAYVALVNLLAGPLFSALYSMHQPTMQAYFTAFESILDHNLPVLSAHFRSLDLKPCLYLLDWLYTLYSRPLPLDIACRVWDAFLGHVSFSPEGDEESEYYLFAVAVAILRAHQRKLLEMDFIQSAQFLTRPIPSPTPEVDADRLVKFADGVALVGHSATKTPGGGGNILSALAVKKPFSALVRENLVSE